MDKKNPSDTGVSKHTWVAVITYGVWVSDRFRLLLGRRIAEHQRIGWLNCKTTTACRQE
jgi:hypothetical protein